MQSSNLCLLKSQSHTSSPCWLFHKYILQQVKMALVRKEIVCVDSVLACWYKIAYTVYLECLGGNCCVCACIKPRSAFLLLMTVEKVKRMQENLTLVVSWSVGENQVMQWGFVAWKCSRHPFKVKFKSLFFKEFFLMCFAYRIITELAKKEIHKCQLVCLRL